ncbi:MAG: RodZ domain-containing protein [Rubrobacteraceae bacterium]
MGRDHRPHDEAFEESLNIGPTLLETRQEKGLSLGDVEQATKIRKRYLEGLERDDYTVLPDAVYVQGFLKTYANYLGLDGEEISDRLKKRRAPRRERQIKYEIPVKTESARPLLSPVGLAGTEKRRISTATLLTVAIAVLVLAAVIGALYYVGSGSLPAGNAGAPGPDEREQAQPKQELASESKKEQAAPENPDNNADSGAQNANNKPERKQASAKEKQPTKAPDTLRVEVRVKGSASWLSVLTDGEVAFNQLGEPGFSQVFEADDGVSVSAGNAGSVSVRVNGQDAGVLGGPGEVLTRNFTKKTAE